MATTLQRRIEFSGAFEGVPGLAKIVRATAYKRGWIMVGHDDRMMAYPTGGFNSATASTGGGPLAVAGADANGGFRVIAKEPNVSFQIGPGASTVVTVTNSLTLKVVLLTGPGASLTAAEGVQAVQSNAEANKLVDLTYTGTGAGLIAVAAATSVPWVRILGVAGGEFDATDVTGADTALDKFAHYAQIMQGSIALVPDSTTPPVAGQVGWIKDNDTVTADWAPLLLPVFVDKISGGMAFCRLPQMRSA